LESRPMQARRREKSRAFWWTEWIYEDLLEAYRVERVIHESATKYQRLAVLETAPFGLSLLLDGKMQSSLLDEHIYHETLVHPAMALHGDPRRVAVIGGGEGSALREVARWKTVEEAYMVDIDQEVVELSRKYLPQLSGSVYEDPRVRLVFEDGRKWLKSQNQGEFDVVIVDLTDPLEGGPSYLLYTEEFYKIVRSRLSEKGVFATQATSPVHNTLSFQSIKLTVSQVFARVSELVCFMISFSAPWGFVYGSARLGVGDLSAEAVEQVMRMAGVDGLRFYSGEVHRALLELTKHYTRLRQAPARIIRDSSPLFIK